MPWALNGFRPEVVDHLVVNPVCGSAQRQFAQRSQIADGEETFRSAPRGIRQIDLALTQPPDQFVGSDVDKNHIVSALQQPVGNCFTYGDSSDPRHNISETFKVLNV